MDCRVVNSFVRRIRKNWSKIEKRSSSNAAKDAENHAPPAKPKENVKVKESEASSSILHTHQRSTSFWNYNESLTYLRNSFNSFFASPAAPSSMTTHDKKDLIHAGDQHGSGHKRSICYESTPTREALKFRTLGLVEKLRSSNTNASRIVRIEELCAHLIAYPECSCIAWNEQVVPTLMKMKRYSTDRHLDDQLDQCFAILGLVDPVKSSGIRMLSIDGGGTRGLMALEILDALQELCPKNTPLYSLFDYVVGVSTGALIVALLAGLRLDIEKCKQIYREVSVKLFYQNRMAGSYGLIRRHSYYNTEQWIAYLREIFGEVTLMETVTHRTADELIMNRLNPKMGIVSCVAHPRLEPFIFRNYYYHPNAQPNHLGSGEFKLWEALRASAAAPGYFSECKLGYFIHQDGGVLANNPTALGLHECRLLWPDEPIHCVLSIGNGRMAHLPYRCGSNGEEPQNLSIIEKLYHAVASATDTEKVHTCLNDLLPPNSYYRTSPYMTRPYSLDETAPDVLDQIQNDAKLYVRKNEVKLKSIARKLLMPRKLNQKARDFARKCFISNGFDV